MLYNVRNKEYLTLGWGGMLYSINKHVVLHLWLWNVSNISCSMWPHNDLYWHTCREFYGHLLLCFHWQEYFWINPTLTCTDHWRNLPWPYFLCIDGTPMCSESVTRDNRKLVTWLHVLLCLRDTTNVWQQIGLEFCILSFQPMKYLTFFILSDPLIWSQMSSTSASSCKEVTNKHGNTFNPQ